MADHGSKYTFLHVMTKQNDPEMVDQVSQIAESTDNALKAFFAGNIVVSILSAGALQYLWGMINTLQILVLTVLFTRLEIPLNAEMIMVMILKLCSLEFIPSGAMLSLFDFRDTDAFLTIVS